MPGAHKVRVQIEDQQLCRHFEKIIASKSEFIVLNGEYSERIDLLIMELKEVQDQAFELIQDLLNNKGAGEIFIASGSTDQQVLINSMRSGAREFFGPDTEDKEIIAALDRFIHRQAKSISAETSADTCRIISVMGSKGGVGTTTVAVNLAVSLAGIKGSGSVALLDMNLAGDIPIFLELEPLYTWSEITRNVSRLDATFLKSIMTVDSSGVSILPSPGHLDSRSMATPEIVESIFRVMRPMFDFIILDTGQLLNDTALKILDMSDKIFVVVVQSLPYLAKINRVMGTFKDLGHPDPRKIHIVLNRFLKNTSIDTADVEQYLEKKVFWSIPNDYQTAITAINKGRPLETISPKKEITKSFTRLAASLTEDAEKIEQKRRKWLFF